MKNLFLLFLDLLIMFSGAQIYASDILIVKKTEKKENRENSSFLVRLYLLWIYGWN